MGIKRNTLRGLLILLVLISLALPGFTGKVSGNSDGIQAEEFDSKVILYAAPGDGIRRYAPPPVNAMRAPATADIQVTYQGNFPAAALTAFEYAVSIWESQISSPVAIEVVATWEDLSNISPNVLGGAGPAGIFRDFQNAPLPNTWYPSALANKLSGQDRSPSQVDIEASFNSSFPSWDFGTDGNPELNRIDFASVVLHEIGHGLGFLGSMNVTSGNASWGWRDPEIDLVFPSIFDQFSENSAGTSLLSIGSAQLYQELTGDNIYFDGPSARAANNGTRVKLHAPANWQGGSSYSHVNDIYDNSPNALMTWSLRPGEAIHDPGPITLGILGDLGWEINSTPQQTAEPVSFIPFAMKASSALVASIHGRVLQEGTQEKNVTLGIRRFDPISSDWVFLDHTAVSNNHGLFDFLGLPPLNQGEVYNVFYNNTTFTPDRLWVWSTPYITEYDGSRSIDVGEFDIGEVNLVAPPDTAEVSPPTTFRWQRRTAPTTDRYALHINNFDETVNEYFALQGYVGEYTLENLPESIPPGDYFWDIYIFTPDYDPSEPFSNGWGWSLDLREISFIGPGTSSMNVPNTMPKASFPEFPAKQH